MWSQRESYYPAVLVNYVCHIETCFPRGTVEYIREVENMGSNKGENGTNKFHTLCTKKSKGEKNENRKTLWHGLYFHIFGHQRFRF